MSEDKIIEIEDGLRIRDYDESNYVLERSTIVKDGKHAGDVRWGILAYCGTAKGLVFALRDKYIIDATVKAKGEAIKQFKEDGWENWILKTLPNKSSKKKIKEGSGHD